MDGVNCPLLLLLTLVALASHLSAGRLIQRIALFLPLTHLSLSSPLPAPHPFISPRPANRL